LVLLATAAAGCAAEPPPPPQAPPPPPQAPDPAAGVASPRSVTAAHPGGDAADPELAAFSLLEREGFEYRRDRYNTLSLQLMDAKHWRRVKLWGYATRVAFRFGDEHYGVVAVWYEPAKGPDDPESCLKRFIDEGRPAAEAFGVDAREVRLVRTLQQDGLRTKPMVIDVIDAQLKATDEPKEMAGAIAAYTSWPGTCLIQGFVVIAAKHGDIARRIRERWVVEGAPRLEWHPRVSAAPAFDSR
jgi:hypothetical protein